MSKGAMCPVNEKKPRLRADAMKILAVDCRMWAMSGIGVYIRNLLPLCMRRLPHVHFKLLGDQAALRDAHLPENGSLIPCAAPIYSLREQWSLPRRCGDAHALWVPHYNIPLAATLPLVVTVHDVIPLALPELFSVAQRCAARLFFAAAAKKARVLLTVSRFSREEFLLRVDKSRSDMLAINNGVDRRWFAARRVARESPHPFPYLAAIGNLKAHKKIPELCKAFAAVCHRLPHNLLLIGKYTGFRSGRIDSAALLRLAPGRIALAGEVDDAALMRLVAHADALVFPSRYEGFGLPLLEALAAGTLVLASDIPTSREICGEAAFYFKADDPASLERALLGIGGLCPERRQGMIAQGRKRAAQFTWERAADAISEALLRGLGEQ